jgi:hypothetical protein
VGLTWRQFWILVGVGLRMRRHLTSYEMPFLLRPEMLQLIEKRSET